MRWCIYHKSDLDGICSAAIVRLHDLKTECLGADYDDDANAITAKIPNGATVFIVDFCLFAGGDIEPMISLAKRCHVIWIDHHISAIKAAEKVGFAPDGLRAVGKGACYLTWLYLFGNRAVPQAVRLLSKRDVWQRDEEWPKAQALSYALEAHDVAPDWPMWGPLFEEPTAIYPFLEIGQYIARYKQRGMRKAADHAFLTQWDKYSVLAINATKLSFEALEDAYEKAGADLAVVFHTDGKKWHLTFYSRRPHVDCSEIARQFGGGGHKGAAGAIVRELPTSFLGESTVCPEKSSRLQRD